MDSRKPLLGSSQRVHYSPLRSKVSNNDYEEIPMISMRNNLSEIEDDISDDIMVRNRSSCSICHCCKSVWNSLTRCCRKSTQLKSRNIHIGHPSIKQTFPVNKICNQKYNIITFLPGVLYNQFKFFLNLYFLIMASSQFIPALQIGYLYTYWAPLCFVLSVTVLREAVDEFRRYCRDKEINSTKYKILNRDSSTSFIESSKIKVSDILILEKDQRVPADIILLKTTEKNGTCFIRTDQLDGETDWKLRIAVSNTQSCAHLKDLFNYRALVHAEKPQTDIHSFLGTYTNGRDQIEESLSIENTIWANTVVASGTAIGVVIYTGQHIRSVMNTSQPSTKIGITDKEINYLTKILFASVILLSFALVAIKGFDGPWYIYMFRFVILFSYIIPISLRVNLDMGKAVYSWLIQKDAIIPGTVVRSSTIPEELGRVNYLLSDKTGTLTQNEMSFKRLHIGTVAYSTDSMDELSSQLHLALKKQLASSKQESETASSSQKVVNPKVKSSTQFKVLEVVKAVAICHNVTPVYEDNGIDKVYQASSPDEIALVKWTESVGLTLFQRDLNQIELQTNYDQTMRYTILQIFPFSSESKRMGTIVRDEQDGKIVFYLKGADSVMSSIVKYNDWLNEECENMAREGLRTLVVAKKVLNEVFYKEFERQYSQAKLSLVDRARKVNAVVESLERDMELLCVTGVEDKLQTNVRPTLELLSNAGIKVWMLTGDKLETAICIAKSSRLVSRDQEIHVFQQVKSRTETHLELNSFRRKAPDTVLIIDGTSLDTCLQYYAIEFVELACMCPSVVVCRCSPTQKAKIVTLLQKHTHKCICAIGDGGNDVSMIQAAQCGVGIVGKEGKQASLAADFSITQFCHLGPLLMVHGRNSYKRSASLSQFIIHRGLIISILQAVFSSVFYFSSVSLYQGFLMVGYTTVFTMFPVFSLVLDQDVRREVAIRFPELYHELHKGRSLSLKTFLIWVVVSIYQGGAIMYGGLLLFDGDFSHIVSISFTSLILTELLMVALTIHTWHWLMLFSEAISLAIYFVALVFFKEYFDPQFLTASDFVWKVVVITSITCVPLIILKYLRRKFSPTSYSKLDD